MRSVWRGPALVVAVTLLAPSCGRGALVKPLGLTISSGFTNSAAAPTGERRGSRGLHRAVLADLLTRPQLPFAFRGKSIAARVQLEAVAARLESDMQDHLSAGRFAIEDYAATVVIYDPGSGTRLSVVWVDERSRPVAEFVYDLSRVPAAFRPGAELSVDELRAGATLRRVGA